MKKYLVILILFLITLTGAFSLEAKAVTSKSYSTNVGITFKDSEKTNNSSSESKQNNSTDKTHSANNNGFLPKTGNRSQGLFLLGLIFIIIMLMIKRFKKEKN